METIRTHSASFFKRIAAVLLVTVVMTAGIFGITKASKASTPSSVSATAVTTAQSSSSRTTILIGDSRTVGIYNTYHGTSLKKVNTTDRYAVWSAKNGTKYSWFASTGISQVEQKIGKNTDVVILMGVNDIPNLSKAKSYASLINKKAKTWTKKGARVYYLSVNPVGKNKNDTKKYYGKTNSLVKNWNSRMQAYLSSNVTYINTYSFIYNTYSTPDGLHYVNDTNRTIYRIIRQKTGADNTRWVLKCSDGKWHAVKSGRIDYTFTGLAPNDYGTWYCKAGAVDTDYNGIARDTSGNAWKVENGKVNTKANGVKKAGKNSYLFKNGKVVVSANGLRQVNGSWYWFAAGQVVLGVAM